MATNIGSAWVELRGRTNRLERDIEKALDPAVKRLGRSISDNISDSIREGFNSVDASDLQIDVGMAGDEAGRRIKEQIEDNLRDDVRLNVRVNIDSATDDIDLFVAYARERLRDIDFRIPSPDWDPDDWEIYPSIDDSSMAEVKQRMDDLKNEYTNMEAELHPGIDFASSRYVSARMARMTRPRFAMIFPVVDPASARLANGILDALAAGSGLRMTLNTLRNIWDMFKNIDKSIPSITLMTGAITGLSAWITTLVSDASVLIVELGRIAGILIPMPGILAGLAIGIGASVAVFRDFGAVLPEVGAKFADLQDQMSLRFWEQVRAPIQNMVDTLFPAFSAGILGVTDDLAVFFGSFANSLSTRLADELVPMFDNLGRSILIASTYTDVFAEIIEILGRHGSEYLPRLASWFGEISTRFRNFLSDAESSGELQQWTDQAIENMGYLGSAIWGVGRIFYELGSIAEEAGGSSLKAFAGGLNGIADIIGREPFRSNLRMVFEEAHNALSTIIDISGPAVTDFFENFADLVATAFRELSPAIGTALREVANALSSPEFSQGFKNFIDGIGEGVIALSESFGPVGVALGSIGTIIGEMASRFGPLLAEVLTIIANMVVSLEGPIIGVVEVLTTLSNAVLRLPGELLILVAAFAKFHGPIMAAVGAFTAFRTAVAIQVGLTGATTALGVFTAGVTVANGAMTTALTPLGAFAAIVWPIAAIAGTALAVGELVNWLKRGEIAPTVDEIKESVRDLANSGGDLTNLNSAFQNFGTVLGADVVTSVDDVSSAFDKLLDGSVTDKVAGFLDGLLPVDGYMEEIEGRVESLDTALAGLLQNGEVDQVDAFIESLKEQGYTMEEINRLLPQTAQGYADGAREAADAAKAVEAEADAQRDAEEAHRMASAAIDTQVSSLGELVGLHRQMAGEILSTRDAERGLEASFDAATAAIETNGKTLDITTEAGRNNQSALDDIAKSAYDLAESMYESGESTADVSERMGAARTAFIESARAMGMSKEEAKALADELGLIPEQIVTEIEANTDRALYNLDGLLVDINDAEGTITIDGDDASGQETLGDLLGDVDTATGMVTINGETFPAEMSIQDFHNYIQQNLPPDIPVGADPSNARDSTRAWRDDEVNAPIEVNVEAEPANARSSTRAWRDDEINNPAVVQYDANVDPARASTDSFRGNMAPGTMDIDGNVAPATDAAETIRQDVNTKPAMMGVNISPLQLAGELSALRDTIAGISASVNISATAHDAHAAITGVVVAAATALPSVRVTASTVPAIGQLSGFLARTNTAKGTVSIEARDILATKALRSLVVNINKAYGTVNLRGQDRLASATLRQFVGRVNRSSGEVDITASTLRASASVTAFIARTNERSATITIRTRRIEENANGSVNLPGLQAYARGGIRRGENHVAQIARGGVTRIWAEPETGGEAYIPLAMTKRRRSLRILEQVASIMGQQLTPLQGKSVRRFAQGGILSRRDVNLLSQRASNSGNIGTTSNARTTVAAAPSAPVQITNNFEIHTTQDMDIDTLAREVSRQVMFSMR